MLYYDQSISKITQMLQCSDQLIIISLMQTDTWFIQNISNAHKPGTDLGRQTDSLCLATGQCACRTIKCQIIKAYIDQKMQSRPDFL